MTNQVQRSLKSRVGIVGAGLTANFLVVKGFDLVLYPVVMAYFGTALGATIMWVLSFAICYATIKFYDWSKTDWLGIETLKEVRENEGKGWLRKLLRWALSKGDALALIALSIKFDPFICTVYMRQGAHQYNGMTKRDWTIFLTSVVISNAWWTLVVFTGLSAFEWIRHLITSAF